MTSRWAISRCLPTYERSTINKWIPGIYQAVALSLHHCLRQSPPLSPLGSSIYLHHTVLCISTICLGQLIPPKVMHQADTTASGCPSAAHTGGYIYPRLHVFCHSRPADAGVLIFRHRRPTDACVWSFETYYVMRLFCHSRPTDT